MVNSGTGSRLRSPIRARGFALCAAGILAAAPLALSGCAMFRKFDVAQIHQESALRQGRNPVIVIHGFIGAKLKNRHTQESAWGRFINAVKRCKTDDLSLPIDRLPITENRDDLVAYAIYESVAGVKFYGALLDALEMAGGYQFGDINNPRPEDTGFVYYYDWRRDIGESAIGLGRAIQQIKGRLKNPDLRFDIVAHSMGGLVAEYYLKYGTEDVLGDGQEHAVTYAGAANLGRVILVGTPLRGTMHALQTMNTGFSRTMSPEVLFTMPSIYQLLPDDARGHLVDPQGTPIDADLYDAETWVKNGWSIFGPRGRSPLPDAPATSGGRPAADAGGRPAAKAAGAPLDRMKVFLQAALDRARALHAALRNDAEGGSPVPIHVFGSDCIPTLDRVVLKQTPSGTVTMFNDETAQHSDLKQLERVMLVPGDGTVTADSLLSLDAPTGDPSDGQRAARTFSSTFFFCETHGLLPANRGFQDNLFYVLFYSPQRPAPLATFVGGR